MLRKLHVLTRTFTSLKSQGTVPLREGHSPFKGRASSKVSERDVKPNLRAPRSFPWNYICLPPPEDKQLGD